jgi:hypothetical protein
MASQFICPVCGNEVFVNFRNNKESCPWCKRNYWIVWNKGHVELKEVSYNNKTDKP